MKFKKLFVVTACAAIVIPLASCSSSSEPAAHTPDSILEALRSKPEIGLECDEPKANGVVCIPTGQGSFDQMSIVNVWISALDFDKTLENYRLMFENRCSKDTDTFESAIDGTTKTFIPYETTQKEFLVIGKNWATLPIAKQMDAQVVSDVTGGVLVTGKDWCESPRPLVDYGK